MSASGRKGGSADRVEPHRLRQERIKVPSARRRGRAADHGRGQRREPARLDVRRADLDNLPAVRGPGRPRRRPVKLHADTGYDNRRVRRYLAGQGISARIACRGINSGDRVGRRRGWSNKPSPGCLACAGGALRPQRHHHHRVGHPRRHTELPPPAPLAPTSGVRDTPGRRSAGRETHRPNRQLGPGEQV